MKLFAMILTSLMMAPAAFAESNDLTINFPYYHTKFEKMTCAETQEPGIATPQYFQQAQMSFPEIVVNITLDRALLLGNFSENGVQCRYNAIFSVNKAKFKRFLTFVESKAYAADGSEESCQGLKQDLDQRLAYVPYKIDHDFVAVVFPKTALTNECPGEDVLTVFRRIRRHQL